MTDPVWWMIRFAAIGVALFGFLYEATCTTGACIYVTGGTYHR
jgi:hypothetical protein